jgi:hypothetical protein
MMAQPLDHFGSGARLTQAILSVVKIGH